MCVFVRVDHAAVKANTEPIRGAGNQPPVIATWAAFKLAWLEPACEVDVEVAEVVLVRHLSQRYAVALVGTMGRSA